MILSEVMYKYYEFMEMDEEKMMYDLSDHVYILVDLIIRGKKPKHRGSTLRIRVWKVGRC